MQNQARSTNLDLAIEQSIAIDVLAAPGIVLLNVFIPKHNALDFKHASQ